MAAVIKDPEFIDGKWRLEKDPDNQHFYRYRVPTDLAVMGTTIASVEMILGTGMIKLADPSFSGADITVLLGGFGTTPEQSFATARITCTNGERFDRTIWFDKVEN